MRLSCIASLLPLALMACGGGDDGDTKKHYKPSHGDGDGGSDDTGGGSSDGTGDGTGTDGTGDDGGTEPFRPEAGHWIFGAGSLTFDTCNFDSGDLGLEDSAGYNLNNTGADSFVLQLDGGTTPTQCTYDQTLAYSCLPTNGELPIADTDIVLLIKSTQVGVFYDTTSMLGSVTLEVECRGGDCDYAEWYGYSFPCQLAFDADGLFEE